MTGIVVGSMVEDMNGAVLGLQAIKQADECEE